jgi:hypothetical protein
MTTPRLPPCPRLRAMLLLLPFPEWRKLVRLRLIHGLTVNATARRMGMGHWRAKRIERLAMAALGRAGWGGVDGCAIIPLKEHLGGVQASEQPCHVIRR